MRRKLTLVLALVAVICTAMVGGYGLFSTLRQAEQRIETEYVAQGRISAARIEDSLRDVQEDVLFLSRTPPIQGIIRARDGGGYDSLESSPYQTWVERLQAIFEGMMRAKGIYMQLRYLDEAGNELVRVDYDRQQTRRIPPEELQNKADRYYFAETMKLGPDQVYVSPLDLNRERGQIETPHKPTIRYAVPIFDPQGERRGLVIANVWANTFLRVDLIFPHPEQTETFIVDGEGYYLHYSAEPEKEWGGPADLNTGHGLRRDFPTLADRILSGRVGEVYTDDGHIIFYAPVHPYPDSERFWVVGVMIPRAVVYAPLRPFALAFAGIFVLALAVAAGTAYMFAGRLTAPLETLRQGVRQVAAGDLGQRVEITSGDEIEELAGDFNLMAEELEHLYGRVSDLAADLERKVEERTRALRESEDRLRLQSTALESAANAVVITDCEGRIIWVNPAFTRLTGYTLEEALGQNPRRLKSGVHGPSFYQDLWETILSGRVWHGEIINRRKDGSLYTEEMTITPVRDVDGEITHFIAIKQDITERKRAEGELRVAKEAAEAASRAKSQFLANMSHELRTPLNAIIGFSEILQGQAFGALNPKQARYVDNIVKSGRHLLQLVNDILDLTRVEAGKLELQYERFPVAQALQDILNVVRAQASKKNITLSLEVVDGVGQITADQIRFKQIMYNLLSNAVKFTPEGGKVTVVAKELRELRELMELPLVPPVPSVPSVPFVLVSVSDTGIGIAAEDMPRIWREFEQADQGMARRYEGAGLGLPLTKRLVELHGGRIWAESEGPGQGSTFTFVLPIADLRLPICESQVETPKSQIEDRKSKILVVEDNPRANELLRIYLTQAGYEVHQAYDGEEGLKQARQCRPSVIVLDILLPRVGGWQVLDELKRHPETRDIPVVIVSIVEQQRLGFSLGAADYFVKPIDRARFLARLQTLIPDLRSKIENRKSKILVVDDEPQAVELVTALLEPAGYEVLRAYGGQEGIDLALAERPDLVVLDLMMPQVSGFDVVRTLKAESATRDLPIVILTAKELTGEERHWLEEQVSLVARKGGFSPEELLRDIEALTRE